MKLNSAIIALPFAVQVLAFPIIAEKRGSISNVEESLESNNKVTRSTDPSGGDVTAAIQARNDKSADTTKPSTNTPVKASKKSTNQKGGNQKRTIKKTNQKTNQKSSSKKVGNQKRANTEKKVKSENEEKAEVRAAALALKESKGSKATKRAEPANAPGPKAPES